VKRRSSNLAPFFFANSRTVFASAMGSSFKNWPHPGKLRQRHYFNYARVMKLAGEFGELYTCYNRSKFQVMHSLDVHGDSRKLIVFMGWIKTGYPAISA
jgi:hypothetical protein